MNFGRIRPGDVNHQLVATVCDALTIAGLEMLSDPDMVAYCTTESQRIRKRIAIDDHKRATIRRVLRSDVKFKATTADPEYIFLLSRLAAVPDTTLLTAVNEIKGVLDTVPFAQYHRELSELSL